MQLFINASAGCPAHRSFRKILSRRKYSHRSVVVERGRERERGRKPKRQEKRRERVVAEKRKERERERKRKREEQRTFSRRKGKEEKSIEDRGGKVENLYGSLGNKMRAPALPRGWGPLDNPYCTPHPLVLPPRLAPLAAAPGRIYSDRPEEFCPRPTVQREISPYLSPA